MLSLFAFVAESGFAHIQAFAIAVQRTVPSSAMINNPFGEVSVLPVVIPASLVLFVVLLCRLRSRRAFSIPRTVVAAAVAVYAAGVVGNTVFPIFLDPPRSDTAWTPAITLIPFSGYEVADAITNLLVFLPLGVLVALLLVRPAWWRVMTITAAVSLAIEMAQLAAQGLFAGGHVADVNDFMFNTAGGALGYGLFLMALRIPRAAGFVDRFRWNDPAVP